MDFCYLTETKNEFNNFMANILIPNIYNDIYSMLEKSIELLEKLKKEKKDQGKTVTDIFIMMLKSKAELNNFEIESEYNRIKATSGCSDWFDNLIKASFKSYVLFLTWNNETKSSKFADNKFIDEIQTKDFVHRAFIESCNYFISNPEIVMKKTLKREIYGIINVCIENAIRFMLPYNEMLQEYLQIDFNRQTDANRELDELKMKVNNLLDGRHIIGGDVSIKPEIQSQSVDKGVDVFISNNKSEPVVIQNETEPTVYMEENITLCSSNDVNLPKPNVIPEVKPVEIAVTEKNMIDSFEPFNQTNIKLKEVENILNGGGADVQNKKPQTSPEIKPVVNRKINVVRSNKSAKNETMDAFFSGMVK